MADINKKVFIEVDIKQAEQDINKLTQELNQPIKLDINSDRTQIEKLINDLKTGVKNIDVGVKINNKDVSQVKKELSALKSPVLTPTIDNTEVIKTLDSTKQKFEEVKLTLDQQIQLKLDAAGSATSARDLIKTIKELEGIALQAGDANSDAFKKATQAAGQLKDRLEDVKDATKTFTAGDPVEGLSKGFGNLKNKILDLDFQGFTEEVSRLNVLSGQLTFGKVTESLGGLTKGFAQLGKVLLTNPIFLLAATIGLVIANFDSLLSLIDGVSDADMENLEIAKERSALSQERVDNLSLEENSLKLQGKTEKEILQLKIEALNVAIKDQQIALLAQKQIAKQQYEAEVRNKEILKGLLDFINVPIGLILKAVDAISAAFGEATTLAEDFKESVSTLIFDPDEVKKEGDAAVAEQEKILNQLESQRDGAILAVQNIDKKASEDAIERAKKQAEAIAEIESELVDRRASERDKELQGIDKFYAEKRKLAEEDIKDEDKRNQIILKLNEQQKQDRLKVLDDFFKESKAKQEEFDNFLRQNDPSVTFKELREREIADIAKKYDDELLKAQNFVTEQVALEKNLQDEIEAARGRGEDTSKLEERLAEQTEAVKKAADTQIAIENQKNESISEKNNEFVEKDKEIQLQTALLRIQNARADIGAAQKSTDERIALIGQEFSKLKEIRDADYAKRIADAKGNEEEIKKIKEEKRAADLEAEKAQTAAIQAERDKQVAQIRGAVDSISQTISLTKGLISETFDAASQGLTNVLNQGVQTFATLSSETATNAEKTTAAIQLATQALDAVNQVIQANAQERIQSIEDGLALQLEANQKETDSKIASLDDQKSKGILNEQQYKEAVAKINKEASDKDKTLKDDALKKEQDIKRKAFNQEKAIKIAQTVAGTAQAIVTALAGAGNPYTGAVLAALFGAIGAAQIAVISSQKFPEAGSSGGGGGAPSVSIPSIDSANIPNAQTFSGQEFVGIGQTQPTQPQQIVIQNNISANGVSEVQKDINDIETRANIIK